jgi:hypothetical protein
MQSEKRACRVWLIVAAISAILSLAFAAPVYANETALPASVEPGELWSLAPIADPDLPAVAAADWPLESIDHFVLARLEEHGMHPVGEADRRTWLRRVTFDLTGLPPTPAEIGEFLRDETTAAYEHVVDRLLASPHYGERSARRWMDLARYGEDQAHSFKPRLYPQGFRYRDWLIAAFNNDMPYDQFVAAQIAADHLQQDGDKEELAALGFFAMGPVYYGGNKQKELDEMEDRVDTFARGILGLTVACARCHDHKFDPVSSKDYYALAGVFASSEYVEVPLAPPDVVEAYDKAQKAIEDLEEEIEDLEEERDKQRKDGASEDELRELREKRDAKRKELEQLKDDAPEKYPFCHAWKDAEEPRDLPVYERGNAEAPGEEVHRRFLAAIAGSEPKPFTIGSGRLELARSVISRDNPLTARVIVNRVWQHLFGRGIVATPSNFGSLGARPTHPDLLDHLASRLMDDGWSLKQLVRTIVLSATYRQSSEFDSFNYERDSGNTWLWRMNRRRLDVEAWRDAMLSVSGQLDPTIGGPSLDLDDSDNRRRTLYAKISRHDLNSLLRLFDFPDPNVTSGARSETTVPLQQLFVLNSEFVVRQAKALAARLTEGDAEPADRIRMGFELAYGRPATDREIDLGLQFLNEASGDLAAWEQYAQVLLSANEFMYVD